MKSLALFWWCVGFVNFSGFSDAQNCSIEGDSECITTDTCDVGVPKVPQKGAIFVTHYEWTVVDYKWTNEDAKSKALEDGLFIPKNNIITGIKPWKGIILLTTPRWKPGVPATISFIPKTSNSPSPLLEPFPNWEMQEIGNCSAFQFVQSMETDLEGRVWIIDSGRVDTLTEKARDICPPKLVIIDSHCVLCKREKPFPEELKAYNERHSKHCSCNEIVRVFEFPAKVTPPGVFLNDIVIDSGPDYYAYITDMRQDTSSAIIVYSYKKNEAWRVSDPNSMTTESNTCRLCINSVPFSREHKNLDGIGLSPITGKTRRVFYQNLADDRVFSISTKILKDPKLSTNVTKHIRFHGRKLSISDGMIFDNTGLMYTGYLGCNAIGGWNIFSGPLNETQHILARSEETLQWADTFGIDDDSLSLFTLSNKLPSFMEGKVNVRDINYRVLSAVIGAQSYKVPFVPQLVILPFPLAWF